LRIGQRPGSRSVQGLCFEMVEGMCIEGSRKIFISERGICCIREMYNRSSLCRPLITLNLNGLASLPDVSQLTSCEKITGLRRKTSGF
jgi:hypothetical protein